MRIAFVLYRLFAFGGLSRDLPQLIDVALERGHQVRIYTMRLEMSLSNQVECVELPVAGFASHRRYRRFTDLLEKHVSEHPVDLLVGLNKMPGLDVYYAGDSCFIEKAFKQRPWLYRVTPRFKHFAAYERAVFDPASPTRILTIAPGQERIFQHYYGTPSERFYRLPPGIETDRGRGVPDGDLKRELVGGGRMLLHIGSGFIKKGLDRSIRSLRALSDDVHLVVAGEDRRATPRFRRLAIRQGVGHRVHFLGGRDDVAALLATADGLLLPAYDEAAGKVILEAMIAGLPVVVTANCGYADYVRRARAGIVVEQPFEQARFDAEVRRLLTSPERSEWCRSGKAYAQREDLTGLPDRVIAILEEIVVTRGRKVVVFVVDQYDHVDPRFRLLLPLALGCRARGLYVRVLAYRWRGPTPPGIDIRMVPIASLVESQRTVRFSGWVDEALDALGADYRLAYRLSESERESYDVDLWLDDQNHTPGLFRRPPIDSGFDMRGLVSARTDDVVIMIAGADLVSHGFERLIRGISRLPEEWRRRCRIAAVGSIDTPFLDSVDVLGVADQVWVGDLDVRAAFAGTDLFVDFSYTDGARSWTFEAIASGIPALVSEAVEHARYVAEYDAGIVLRSPFVQEKADVALRALVTDASYREKHMSGAADLIEHRELFGAVERNVDRIERVLEQRSVDAVRHPRLATSAKGS